MAIQIAGERREVKMVVYPKEAVRSSLYGEYGEEPLDENAVILEDKKIPNTPVLYGRAIARCACRRVSALTRRRRDYRGQLPPAQPWAGPRGMGPRVRRVRVRVRRRGAEFRPRRDRAAEGSARQGRRGVSHSLRPALTIWGHNAERYASLQADLKKTLGLYRRWLMLSKGDYLIDTVPCLADILHIPMIRALNEVSTPN